MDPAHPPAPCLAGQVGHKPSPIFIPRCSLEPIFLLTYPQVQVCLIIFLESQKPLSCGRDKSSVGCLQQLSSAECPETLSPVLGSLVWALPEKEAMWRGSPMEWRQSPQEMTRGLDPNIGVCMCPAEVHTVLSRHTPTQAQGLPLAGMSPPDSLSFPMFSNRTQHSPPSVHYPPLLSRVFMTSTTITAAKWKSQALERPEII